MLAATVLTMGASASAPPGPFFNGFENAADVGTTDQAMFNVSQVATGPGTITSASGSYHALPFTRPAVDAAAMSSMTLVPR